LALRVEPAGNSLKVVLSSLPATAVEYLTWSDQFSSEFDKIREAVARPSARLDGDYGQFYQISTPNLTAAGAVASRLASRSKAFLMRGRPEDALRELTLLHDLSNCLEGKPAQKLVPFPIAMANVSITGMYVDAIDYGMRYGMRSSVWRAAELSALEDQLSQTDLVTPIWSAMESDRVGYVHLLESSSRFEAAQGLGITKGKASVWQAVKSPTQLAFDLMPRGWLFQNLANLAILDQKLIDSVDHLQAVIRPHAVEDAAKQIAAEVPLHRRSSYWFLARRLVPSVQSSLMVTAHAQAGVNEALIACALERFHLDHGAYPAALSQLVPQFIPLQPTDPVNGEPLHFRVVGPRRFLLYSVGWDEKDDKGAAVDSAGNGDWVWGKM
jgi:hypothetical protein